MKKSFFSNTGIFFLKVISYLPFPVIYLLSDIMFFLLYYIFRYRKSVINTNLKKSFPDKTEKEIKSITKKFYKHLSDITLEAIKVNGVSEKTIKKRMTFKNPEVVNRLFENGQSVIALTMHFNNWEWTCSMPFKLKHKVLAVYKPLHNAGFDNFMNENRSRFGAETVSHLRLLRRTIKAVQKNEPVYIGLAGDQTPPEFHKLWMMFMNQETLFYPGPAVLAKRFGFPVIFQKTIKIKRGYYETSFEVLIENPKEYSDSEIMKIYTNKMEELINLQPEFYLWSHRRWKHKRPADIPLTV